MHSKSSDQNAGPQINWHFAVEILRQNQTVESNKAAIGDLVIDPYSLGAIGIYPQKKNTTINPSFFCSQIANGPIGQNSHRKNFKCTITIKKRNDKVIREKEPNKTGEICVQCFRMPRANN